MTDTSLGTNKLYAFLPYFSGWAQRSLDFLAKLEVGTLELVLPNGEHFRFAGTLPGPSAQLQIKQWRALKDLLSGSNVAFAEAFIEEKIDTPDLPTLIELLALNRMAPKLDQSKSLLKRLSHRLTHWCNENSKQGSRRNISFHYDMGNEFYRRWLDPSMTYSSALYETSDQGLEAAQESKYRAIAERLNLSPGDRVLEIGCGWGGFAEFVIRNYDVYVVGLTLSTEQRDFALARAEAEGFAERFEVRLQDYRDVWGQFDAIASIEMLEAVGERYWPGYFQTLHDRLKCGGKASLQVITIDETRFDGYRKNPDFIQMYIFPGGMLPSVEIVRSLAQQAGLTYGEEHRFGHDYARTLAEWRDAFTAQWESINALGYDQRFHRLWTYYLGYCEGGFRSKNIDVCQFSLTKD